MATLVGARKKSEPDTLVVSLLLMTAAFKAAETRLEGVGSTMKKYKIVTSPSSVVTIGKIYENNILVRGNIISGHEFSLDQGTYVYVYTSVGTAGKYTIKLVNAKSGRTRSGPSPKTSPEIHDSFVFEI